MKQLAWLAAALLAAIPVSAYAGPNLPTKPIEQKYYANGPWTVTTTVTATACDSKGDLCDIYFPANLGANGFVHPIIVWGNGTGTSPVPASTVAYYLRHLASWGFVVVATQDGTTGIGQTIIDSANYIKARNTDASSVFFGKLDVTKIGAVGHSQGATGVINAMIHSGGLIRTAVALHLPSQIWCSSPDNCLQTATLAGATAGSILYVSGSADTLISPDTQLFGSQLNSNTAYYNATPSVLTKAKAIIKGTNHNDVQGNPSCPSGLASCNNGVDAYLGYPTAWLMWQLQGAADGQQAFKASTGEIYTETTNWQSILSNVP